MTSPRRRKNAIVLPIPQAAELTALLATLDEFIRSSPRIAAELAAFLASHGARFPEFDASNMIDELSFTALGFRQLLAAGEDARHQESPCHHPTR
jgi:hypothetical protein